MSAFAQHAGEYLRLRQALGHELADAARLLPRFVAYLDATGASAITDRGRAGLGPASRRGHGQLGLGAADDRGPGLRPPHVRHRPGAPKMPPLGLVTFRKHWRPPFIYSEADIKTLMAVVPQRRPHAASGGHVPDA